MNSKFFTRILFSSILILTISIRTYGQYQSAQFEFNHAEALAQGQLVDSTNTLGDSIRFNFKAKYSGYPGDGLVSFWKVYIFHEPAQTKMDSTKGELVFTVDSTGIGRVEVDDYQEKKTNTSAMLLSEGKTYYLYATLSTVNPSDSVLAVSSGITVRHQPYVDSTLIRPVVGSYPKGDTVLNSGGLPTPKTAYDISWFTRDLDDDEVEVKLFLNEADTLTYKHLTYNSQEDTMTGLAGSYLIGCKALNDTVLYFDMMDFFPEIIPKGYYYVYVAGYDKKNANVYHSSNRITIKHSPQVTLDSPPAIPGFAMDTVDTGVQQKITIGWSFSGKDGDIDLDDNATIAIFMDTAGSYHGDLSIGGVADSFYVKTPLPINLTGGYTIREDGDWENDMWVLDLTELSQTQNRRIAYSIWRFYALITDGADTIVAASPGSTYFKHTPHLKFLQDFGGAEELTRSSLASASPLGKDQVRLKKGDIFRINFESFDLDTAQQYIRLVASNVDTTVYFKDFTFSDEVGTADAWLINSKHGSARQDSVDSVLITNVDTYYDWDTGNMDNIGDDDYYIYAFVSTTGSPDTFTFGDGLTQDSTVKFLASGTVNLSGTGRTISTSNVRIKPNLVTLTEGDTITLNIYVNTPGNSSSDPVQGIFIHFDLPDTLFEILDQKASFGGVQPYIFPSGAFFGNDTLPGGGTVTLNSVTKQWEFDLEKFSNDGGYTVKSVDNPNGDSIFAQIQIVSKGTGYVNSEETEIDFITDSGRETRFIYGLEKIPILRYSPAITVRTAPMPRITGNVPLQARGSDFSKEITFELREIGSYLPIDDSAFEALNDENTDKSGIQIMTDRDGKFELRGVPNGNYNLVAKTTNYLSSQYFNINVVPGDYLVGINPTRDSLHVDPDINEFDYKELRGGDVSSEDSTGYGDNWVDAWDIDFIETYYSFDTSSTTYGEVGDINGNGEIDLEDLLITSDNYNLHGAYPTFSKVSGKDNSNAKLKLLDIPEIVFSEDEFDVSVWIENVSDLRGYQFIVKYDPNKYELINLERDVTEGDFLISGNSDDNKTVFFTTDGRKGKMYVGCLLGHVKTAEGNGKLVDLRFKAKVNGDTPDIQLTNILVGNSGNKVTKLGDVANMPDEFKLSQNYPNPFNPETNIRFQLPEASKVTLKIYNILGQEIKTVVNENLNAGYHTVKWDGTNNFGLKVASGVYIYQVKAGSFIASKKMVFLK